MNRSNGTATNPGGQLAAENIVGRDDLIAGMWSNPAIVRKAASGLPDGFGFESDFVDH